MTGANHLGLEIVDVRPLTKEELEKPRATFDGAHYNVELDHERLTKQLNNVEAFMKDYKWHSVQEVAGSLHIPENSASAQIRNLRKLKYGAFLVDAVRIQPEGLFMYRMRKPNEQRMSDGKAWAKWLRAEARKEFLEIHER